jgi:hypothetical protein
LSHTPKATAPKRQAPLATPAIPHAPSPRHPHATNARLQGSKRVHPLVLHGGRPQARTNQPPPRRIRTKITLNTETGFPCGFARAKPGVLILAELKLALFTSSPSNAASRRRTSRRDVRALELAQPRRLTRKSTRCVRRKSRRWPSEGLPVLDRKSLQMPEESRTAASQDLFCPVLRVKPGRYRQ